MYGPLYYRTLERDKIRALQINNWEFDKRVSLTPEAKSELSWWITNVTGSHNVLTRELPTCTLTTDTSKLGWGAVLSKQSTGGLWSSNESKRHINYLELFAVFLGLQTFCSSHHDCHIRLMIDNTTAVALLNHMGTSHSDPLNELTKEIWLWCTTHNIWISAAHIAGKCQSKGVDKFEATVENGIDFLATLFSSGLGYSAINTARSALSSVLLLPNNTTFGSHPLVTRFLKGVFELKPSLPRYSVIWDVGVVL